MDNNVPESESAVEKQLHGNTKTPAQSKQKPEKQTAPKKPATQSSKTPIALLILVVIFFGVSAAGSVYLWQELNNQKALTERAEKASDRLNQQLTQFNRALDNRVKRLEKNSSTQGELIATLDKLALFNTKELNRLHASNRVDWLLAEAEYLLRLGNQRLNIERDVQGAEAILIAADKVLAEIEDPSIYPIRQNLAQEILALQSVSKIDSQGLYLQIQAMINSLDSLNEASFLEALQEIKSDESDAYTADTKNLSQLEQVWKTIWSDLKKALVIRRLDEPVAPLLAPEQSYYLKQNLQLMLEQAGLALLNEDNLTFQQNVTKAKSWLSQYFVQSDAAVEAMKRTLESLNSQNIARTLPDISASLRLLKTRIEAMYRAHQLDKNTSLRVEQEEQAQQSAQDKADNAAINSGQGKESTAL